ncbi:MAG: DUF1080 domain-containing protein [Bacteroidetes bacterium]|nr:DUF1080 domain-containing protein [Bacteroidota bacterium]
MELFNGENLDGWTVKLTHHELGENYGNTFRVENGNLINRYDGYENFGTQFGHIYYEKPFSYYRLIAEYRFTGEHVSDGAPNPSGAPIASTSGTLALYCKKIMNV